VDTVTAPSPADNLTGWSWQPLPSGPPIGTRRCNAVSLDYETSDANRNGAFQIRVTVRNEGTEPLAKVVSPPRRRLT